MNSFYKSVTRSAIHNLNNWMKMRRSHLKKNTESIRKTLIKTTIIQTNNQTGEVLQVFSTDWTHFEGLGFSYTETIVKIGMRFDYYSNREILIEQYNHGLYCNAFKETFPKGTSTKTIEKWISEKIILLDSVKN